MITELKKNILKSLSKGIRTDGRKPDEFRNVVVEYGISLNAEGSARVKIGGTEVLAGVKLSVESPYPDTPEEGNLMVGAELLPLSNPEFELGPPGIQAVELARIVDRGVRESKAIDTKKLCVKKGEKVWMVSVDICTINDEGNLIDASSIATIAALMDTKFPEYENELINYRKKTNTKLGIQKQPIAVTVIKIENNFIVDPTTDEEKILDARLTVISTEDGKLCAMQKGGDVPITFSDVEKMLEIGIESAKKLRKNL